MKRNIFTLLLLLAAMSTVSAATSYDLYVAGTQVTSSNASNIMKGVSYDATNKVLTLDNANVKGEEKTGIFNGGIDGLTIKVKGTSWVSSTGANGMCLDKNTTIMSDDFSFLLVSGSDDTSHCGIWMRNGQTLTVQTIYLSVYGGNYALCGTNGGNTETLNLKRCNVIAKLVNENATGSCVSNWGEINTWGVTYDFNGDKYSTGSHALVDANGKNVKTKTIHGRLYVGRYIIDPRYDYTLSSTSPATGIKSGKVKWVSSEKQLQLMDVDMNVTAGYDGVTFYGFSGSTAGLDVWIDGTNKMLMSGGYGSGFITYYRDLLIDGQSRTAAKLTIDAGGSGIYTINGGDVSIGTLNLDITGRTFAICTNANTTLNIGTSTGGSTIRAVCTDTENQYDAIAGFKTCKMTNDATSNGTYFSTGRKRFCQAGDKWAMTVLIDQPTANYDCYIYGNQLNNVNSSNFACEGLQGGTIKWDNSTKTLNLNGVTLNNTSVANQAAIRPGSTAGNTVTITISGTNSIKGGHSSLYHGGNLVINGTGSLSCETGGTFGSLLAGGANVTTTIDVNGKVYFKGDYGYNCNMGSSNTNQLILKKRDKSDYTFEGTTAAITKLYGGLTLTDMDFFSNDNSGGTPGCYFDDEDCRVEQNGGTVAKKVNFYPPSTKYGIYVGGTQVTSCNRTGIGSKYISSGTRSVTYDNSSNTLVLDDATITIPEGLKRHAIRTTSEGDNCTVTLSGTNKLTNNNSDYCSIYFYNNGTIKGGYLVTSGSSRCDLYTKNGALTIKNSEVACKHSIWGETAGTSLTIDNSIVEANNYIGGFGNLYTANTYLIEPKNGKYDTSSKYVVDANGKRTAHVLYGPLELLGIENLETDTTDGDSAVKNIYDTNGGQQTELKRGVNIIRMTDGTVKKVVKR